MLANLSCDPPLGYTTIIPFADQSHKLNFTVSINCKASPEDQKWEVLIWHNLKSQNEWTAMLLTETEASEVQILSSPDHASQSLYRFFSGTLEGRPESGRPVYFTVKFRTSSSESWKWVNDALSLADGEILFQDSKIASSNSLDSYFRLESGFQPENIPSETPHTQLWSLTGKVEGALGRSSRYKTLLLGKPKAFSRWMALVRLWAPWLAPRQGKKTLDLDREAVICSFQLCTGAHLVLLALSGINDVLSLFTSDKDGNILLSLRNDSKDEAVGHVLISVGPEFEMALASAIYQARRLVSPYINDGPRSAEMMKVFQQEIKPEWMEAWYDGLTYCTWNGLGQNLTEEKVFTALDSLEKNHVHITNLIIDDNWQSLNNEGAIQFKRGWLEFEANKKGFPSGLAHTVSQIRLRQPNIQHIAVWHALFGYWGGIAPEGKLAKKYKTIEVLCRKGLSEGTMTAITAEDIGDFYEEFYGFLHSCGIDSVKADAQFYLDELEHADDRRALMKPYQDAWTISSLRWFSTKCISCMSQTPQQIFHSQLPTNRPPIMLRNSDDFYPSVPASHPWHIFCNAHNALLNQHLNALPDWDMFQTDHPWASYHAAARCVSGGPVYFTDEPGKHDIDLIKQMTAQTPKQNTIILRPAVGKSMKHYLDYSEEKLLHVGTFVSSVSGILGIFNVSSRPLSELVNLKEFPSIKQGDECIVRSHKHGKISNILTSGAATAVVGIDLDVVGWEILSAYPLKTFNTKRYKSAKVALVGLLGKMTGSAAIVGENIGIISGERLQFRISLKALGTLGIYISKLRKESIKDDFIVTILGKVIPFHTVKADKLEDVLEIDVEQAWKEMELDSGWSNEVQIEIIMH